MKERVKKTGGMIWFHSLFDLKGLLIYEFPKAFLNSQVYYSIFIIVLIVFTSYCLHVRRIFTSKEDKKKSDQNNSKQTTSTKKIQENRHPNLIKKKE